MKSKVKAKVKARKALKYTGCKTKVELIKALVVNAE